MRNQLLASLLSMMAFAGCVAEPASTDSALDPPGQGIAVGEPHPGGAGSSPASECRLEEAPQGDQGAPVDGVGNVTWIELEGGFWGIVADNGTQYDPLNLCREFQKDGLRIHFGGFERRDMAGTHTWGTYVELDWIQQA